MKTLILATAVALAGSAAVAGPYAGVEYSSTSLSVHGVDVADVTTPRVYVGVDGQVGEKTTAYGEIGVSDSSVSILGTDYGDLGTGGNNIDYKLGVSTEIAKNTNLYGEYSASSFGPIDEGTIKVGIRFRF